MKKQGRNNKKKQMIVVVSPNRGLPTFESTVETNKIFRFIASGTGDLDVTFARLGSLYLFVKTATTTGLLWDRVRYKGMRAFGTTAPCDISVVHGGLTTGIVGDNRSISDSSIGNTYVAKLPKGDNMNAWVKPEKGSQVRLWQSATQGNTAVAFTFNNQQTGVYIDVMVQYRGPVKIGTENNIGPAVVGSTAGDVVFFGLDGLQSSTSTYKPIGVTNIL